jgi:hypothetical protein
MNASTTSAPALRLRKQTIVKYNTVNKGGQGKSDPTIGTLSFLLTR